MKKITREEYKKAIKAKYDLAKEVDISEMLAHPTPGNIRDLCALIAGTKTLKDDESLLKRFFDVKENENLIKQIEKSDIDKLRPVGHFLKGKTKDAKPITIELIALLIDFAPRPYSKFSKMDKWTSGNGDITVPIAEQEIPANEETEKEPKNPGRVPIVVLVNEKAQAQHSFAYKDLNGLKGPEDFTEEKPGTENFKPKDLEKQEVFPLKPDVEVRTNTKMSIRKKIALAVSVIVVIFSVGYTTKQFILPEKECMQWVGDHYIIVDCKDTKLGIGAFDPKPYNEIEFYRKKLKVCDTTTFFKNSKPIVWYSKKDNVVEFFNMDGCHPESMDCELRKITPYMIDKYVRPCK